MKPDLEATLGSCGTTALGDSLDGGKQSLSSQWLASATTTLSSEFASDKLAGITYPRIVNILQLLDESDCESVFCGPCSEPGETGVAEVTSLQVFGIISLGDDSESRRPRRRGGRGRNRGGEGGDGEGARVDPREGELPRRGKQDIIFPQGDIAGDNQKFVCVFQIGLEDDDEFCLVKRILGKSGNNMRRIAEECDAKVRLRGIGSGFLEGANGREANMPLQLNVSCTDFVSYKGAVERVATLLNDLYKHYRRYLRSKGVEPPEVKLSLEEVRRDDLSIDLLSQKAQRSPSQRERDRRDREKDRQRLKDEERERQKKACERAGTEYVEKPDPRQVNRRPRSRDRDDGSGDDKPRFTLPGGQAVPTTPAGRRAAARAGGAAAAAIVSAAARQAERDERETVRFQREADRQKDRDDRERKKTNKDDKEAAPAKGKGRSSGKPPGIAAALLSGALQKGAKGLFSKGKGKDKDKDGAVHKAKAPPPPPPGPPPEDALEVESVKGKGYGKDKGKRSW